MFILARRNLRKERVRLIVAVAGVCSQICLRRFDAEPTRYIRKAVITP